MDLAAKLNEEIDELRREVEKWKKAATDTAFTAERALSRLILAERVCEAALDCDGFFGNTPDNRKRLTKALDEWEEAKTPN